MVGSIIGAFSAFVVGAPSTGAGKTTVSLGLMAALRARGLRVQGFKIGPDYIDPAYHGTVCGRPSINLDPWLTSETFVRETFAHHVRDADVAIVEGVMGLFDSAGQGTSEGSTAHIAKLLGLPVVLVGDGYTASETLAATVLGCARYDAALNVCGVIASRVAGERQYDSLRDAFDREGLPPLLGYLGFDAALELPERHLGLVSVLERPLGSEWMARAAHAVETGLDLDELLSMTQVKRPAPVAVAEPKAAQASIAVARDEAFCFYYEDNLRLLREAGFELVAFSPLHDRSLPECVSGIYLGGGFPESVAGSLTENESMLRAMGSFPGWIWAECGGLIYLCEGFVDGDGTRHRMAGRVPGVTAMSDRLAGFGYKEATLGRDCLLGARGTVLRGHEFHWSRWAEAPGDGANPFEGAELTRGYSDAQVFASYLHVHLGGGVKIGWT